MMILDGSLPATLGALSAIRDLGQRLRAFTGTIVERGGTIILPPDDNTGDSNWGPHLVEFSLHGILGTGLTAEEAMADWLKCAERVIAAERAVLTAAAPADDLREACLIVRTRSANAAAIEQGRRVERALAAGLQ